MESEIDVIYIANSLTKEIHNVDSQTNFLKRHLGNLLALFTPYPLAMPMYHGPEFLLCCVFTIWCFDRMIELCFTS